MTPRTILIALLMASLLLVGATGAAAGSGTVEHASGSEASDVDGDAELPDTLPEAVGHVLLLLGYLADVMPSGLGEAVVGLV